MMVDEKRAFLEGLFLKNPGLTINDAIFATRQHFSDGVGRSSVVQIKRAVRGMAPEDKADRLMVMDLKKVLGQFYAFFNRQDTAALQFTDEDIQLIEAIEKVVGP